MKRVLLVLGVCALIAGPATADFTVEFEDVSPYAFQNVSGVGSVYSGVYNLTVSGDGALNGSQESFCVDIRQISGTGSHYNTSSLAAAPTPGNPMGATKAGQVAYLLDNYWKGTLTSITASALQAAVWEIINETSKTYYNLGDGNMKISGGGASTASTWLKAINDLTKTGYNWAGYSTAGYIVLVSNTLQDYVVRVPVPGAVLLGMVGLGYAGLKLRRKCS
jgi:hypothetical protein